MSLILWSGGCDSTLLLFEESARALAAGEAMPRAISITYNQIPAAEQHRTARRRILQELARRGLKIDHTEFELQRHGELQVDTSHGGLAQPILWLGIAQAFLAVEEDLMLGYIRSDDIWHYKTPLLQAFEATQAVLKKTGKLQLPLEWLAKDAILKDLSTYGLLKLTWYCETVRGTAMKPCGWCPSCKTMAAGRYLAKRKWGYDKPPEPETDDEPKKNSAARRRGQAQRKAPLSRGRRSRKAGETQKRKAARSRRVR